MKRILALVFTAAFAVLLTPALRRRAERNAIHSLKLIPLK